MQHSFVLVDYSVMSGKNTVERYNFVEFIKLDSCMFHQQYYIEYMSIEFEFKLS